MNKTEQSVVTIRDDEEGVVVEVTLQDDGKIALIDFWPNSEAIGTTLHGQDYWDMMVSAMVEAMGLDAIPSEIQERILEGAVNRHSGR